MYFDECESNNVYFLNLYIIFKPSIHLIKPNSESF